jgi:transposase
MEVTGHYWLALYEFLTYKGYVVHVVNPIQSYGAWNAYIRKAKTDRKDALILADLLRINRTEATNMATETVMKLQTLSRTRFAFVDQVAALMQLVPYWTVFPPSIPTASRPSSSRRPGNYLKNT